MSQPEGFTNVERKVCKLSKAVYGLKQASRCWYDKVHKVLISVVFFLNPNLNLASICGRTHLL